MKTQSPQLIGKAGRGRLAVRATTSANPRAAGAITMTMTKTAKTASGPISVRASCSYQRYQEVSTVRRVLLTMAAALLLAATACSAAGSGGSGAPKGNATIAPSFMPTPAGGKTADPTG